MLRYNFKLQLGNSIVRKEPFQKTQENNLILGFGNFVYD